ncbi:hypothetical protein CIB48_g11030 [Xylaria polymorpha]|nr:hypothetical protein CIB48_g11030 [Xylaria polymorpha]
MQGDDDFVKTVSAAQMTTAWHNGDSDKRPHPRHRTKAQRWREQQRAEYKISNKSRSQAELCLHRGSVYRLHQNTVQPVPSSAKTSAPLELSMVLAQSVLAHLARGSCVSEYVSACLQYLHLPLASYSCASGHVAPCLRCLALPRAGQADCSWASDRVSSYPWLLGQTLFRHASLMLPQGPHSSSPSPPLSPSLALMASSIVAPWLRY